MKNYLSILLSFSRKELNGVLILAVLLFLLIISQPITNWLVPAPVADFSAFDSDTAHFLQATGIAGSEKAENNENTGDTEVRFRRDAGAAGQSARDPVTAPDPDTLFFFDPNTVSLAQLRQLGLENRVAATLLNYRNAGGHFFKTEDLKKIYGLGTAIYERLQPYIRIQALDASGQTADAAPGRTADAAPGRTADAPSNPGGPASDNQGAKAAGARRPPPDPATHPVIALNTADSAALLPLPGIGPVLSARIVKYRERLGGFHSAGQLLEVYGLDTAAFQKFRPRLRVDTERVKKIALNAAGYEELRRLPYWTPGQIRIVLNYRKQHGRFSTLDELHEIRALEKHIIQKVMPYLSLENTNQ